MQCWSKKKQWALTKKIEYLIEQHIEEYEAKNGTILLP